MKRIISWLKRLLREDERDHEWRNEGW